MVSNFCGIDNYIHAKYIYQKLSGYGGIYFAHAGKQGDNFYTINLSSMEFQHSFFRYLTVAYQGQKWGEFFVTRT